VLEGSSLVANSCARVLRACTIVVVLLAAAPAGATAAGTYVSLGDSYTAGPFIPMFQKPWGCLKSDHNYPHLTATNLKMTLRDPSCSGAETDDMTAPQGVTPGPNPPQFDSLTRGTTLVTLNIGGNDIGFSSLAEDCFSTSPAAGSPCHDKYVSNGVDEVSRRIAETGPKVAAVLQGIHARSPYARVFVVNYPAIFPDTGGGCWPLLPVSDGDVPWLRAKEKELNAMLATEAAANAAGLIDWYRASIGHDACQPPGIKWVEALVPLNAAAPVHPNLLGMIGATHQIVTAVRGG
jgi:lysophospholipase L1-like esterase